MDALPSSADESEDTSMMWGYSPDGAGWFMMVVSNVLWIALLGLLVWAVIRWFERRPGAPSRQEQDTQASGPSALEILSQRYARGEIDAPTFEQMRERLNGSASPGIKQDMQQQPTMHG